MNIEDANKNPENVAELFKKMEELTHPDQTLGTLLDYFNKLPAGEERCELFAHIGANLIDRGEEDDIEKAIAIAQKLEEQEEYVEYAGALIELIGVEKYYGT